MARPSSHDAGEDLVDQAGVMEHRLPGLSLDREDDSASLLVFLARSRVIEVNLHFWTCFG